MTDLFFATYDELVLLTKAWKMHGSLSYVVVNILIELARRVANLPLVAIPIRAQYQNQARSDGPPETTRAAIVLLPLACGYLSILSTTFIRVV